MRTKTNMEHLCGRKKQNKYDSWQNFGIIAFKLFTKGENEFSIKTD